MEHGWGDGVISIVIPCRNAEAWLAETLASIETQAVALEVIVVDDGSTDGSVEIAEQHPRVRVVRQAWAGASAARNAGTRAASGAFVQYLDADDLLAPGTLAARLARLDAAAADVVVSPWIPWVRQPDGSFAAEQAVAPFLGPRPDIDIFTGAWWPPGAVLYRRAIVDRIGGFRLDLPVIQDARFLLDAARLGARFASVEEPGLRYRIHGATSLSRRDPRAFAEDRYRNALDVQAEWTSARALDDERRRALVEVFGAIARDLFPIDRGRFEDVLARIHALDPGYRPAAPATLRALSGVVGYRSAERIARGWRQAKAVAAPPVRGRNGRAADEGGPTR